MRCYSLYVYVVSDNSDNETSAPVDTLVDSINQETENLAADIVPAEGPPNAELIQDSTTASVPEIDSDFLTALGDPANVKPTYGENIHPNLAERWLPILLRGLGKDNKETLQKELTIPENCKLLRAPTLNPEIAAAISESSRTRDKKFEEAQQQLGLGISAINRALTILVTGGEDKDSKVKTIKMLSDSCRILSDLHFVETQARMKAIIPALDKGFAHVVEDVERDESLFGTKLSDKIKASKTIEKQGLQIKKPAPTQKPAPSTSQSMPRSRYQGNWTAPFRHQWSVMRGGRGGASKNSPTTYNMHRASAASAPPTRNSSQNKRGARRN